MSADLRAKVARDLAQGVRARDKASIARALNTIENRRSEAERDVAALLSALAEGADAGHGHRVGITGSPGVGKSSLVAVLARTLREQGRTLGVVAVDPSSLRSGGALLGDRARMAFDPQDQGLFVRSLATQGAFGGLAHAAHAAVEVLAAAYDMVLIETVGVGQTETAVAHVADTVALVVQPGSGDVLQFLKAGVMEIPDLLVVNKLDQGSTATQAASDLRVALSTLHQIGAGQGDTQVLLTSARDRLGFTELAQALHDHRTQLGREGILARRSAGRLAWAVDFVALRIGTLGLETLGGSEAVRAQLASALTAGTAPLAAAHALLDQLTCIRR